MHRRARKIGRFDEKKAYYLVLHVGGLMNSGAADGSERFRGKNVRQNRNEVVLRPRSVFREAVIYMKAVGITLEHVNISYDKSDKRNQWRFLFRFPRYARRDQDAERVGESFLYAMELLFGPIIDETQPAFVFRLPADLVRHSQRMTFKTMETLEHNRPYEERTIGFPYRFSAATFTDETVVATAWQIAPVLYRHERLRRAAMFLSQSYHHFYCHSVPEIPGEYEMGPPNSLVQTTWENALHNAFKTIEAVIGDPPKKDTKFFRSLKAIGLDPYEQVGYRIKSPICEVIRDMNRARDKRSAHGSLGNRTIGLGEMLEYQGCATHVMRTAIEHELGESVWS